MLAPYVRYVAVFLAFASSLAITAVAAGFAVLVLAGPHGGVLPASLHTATLVLGWLVVFTVPLLVARWVWRRVAPGRVPSRDGYPPG